MSKEFAQPFVKRAKETFDEVELTLGRKVYTRFGDGEMKMMAGWEGKATNQYNSEEFRQELIEVFQNKNFMVGMLPFSTNETDDTMYETSAYQGLFVKMEPDRNFIPIMRDYSVRDTYYSAIALHYHAVYQPERFMCFVKKVRKLRPELVGGKHLDKTAKFFNAELLPVSSRQAYEDTKNIKVDGKFALIATGVSAKPLQNRLWKQGVASIDLGSVADFIAGYNTRSWITASSHLRKHLWKK